MDNIIQDLITLARLETSPSKDVEAINLFELIEQVQQQIKLLLKISKRVRQLSRFWLPRTGYSRELEMKFSPSYQPAE